MDSRADSKAAQLLLPLATGLLLVALNAALPTGGAALPALLVVGGVGYRNLGAGQADRAAGRRAAEIRTAMQGQTAATLQRAVLSFVANGGGSVPGGPYSTMQPGPNRFVATDEVRRLSQFRCVHVEVDIAGDVSTTVDKDRCDR